ncbi:MAG: hypothetical protein ACRD26_12650 [Vicinamibacterales bacterium]
MHVVALCVLAVTVMLFPPAAAVQRESALWGGLKQGTHHVGLTLLFDRDSDRPSLSPGPSETGAPARPMQIVVWYPAEESPRAPLTLREYVELSAGRLGPESDTSERRNQFVRWSAAMRCVSWGITCSTMPYRAFSTHRRTARLRECSAPSICRRALVTSS